MLKSIIAAGGIVVNPNNEKQVYASSFFSGLLRIENDIPNYLFNEKNSSLESITFEGPNYIDVRINGTAFDKSGNLWVTNSRIKNGLKVLRTNGQWSSYATSSVLATGGTAKAVCELVEQLGGEIVQMNFLMELSFLNGREKLGNKEIFAALTY